MNGGGRKAGEGAKEEGKVKVDRFYLHSGGT